MLEEDMSDLAPERSFAHLLYSAGRRVYRLALSYLHNADDAADIV